jgi:hypothetical protein
LKSLFFSENVFKKSQNLSKCPTLMKNIFIFLEIFSKSLVIFEKALHHFKKASILLKMSSKRLRFLIKASISLKKSSKNFEIVQNAPYY